MKTMKIRATREVRALLVELDGLFQKFHEQTAVLANRSIETTVAIDVAADRKSTESIILGCAYRINKASRGERQADDI